MPQSFKTYTCWLLKFIKFLNFNWQTYIDRFIYNFRKYVCQDIKILSSLLIYMSEILHSKCKQYGSHTVALNMSCPCTEMSAWWWLLVTETCSNFTLFNTLCFDWTTFQLVEASWNVMAHAQKPELFSLQNGRVHLNRRGRQFSRLLAAEVCASAVVMLDAPCSEVVWRVLATHSIR